MDWPHFDWLLLASHAIHLFAAFVLALPVAWEREQSTGTLGLRTFPLVAVASCGFILVAATVGGDNPDAQTRVIAGLMTAVGFIGGGAILTKRGGVHGTATAASLWTTGVLGAAVGYELYELAVLISAVNFLTFKVLTPIERRQLRKRHESAVDDVLDDDESDESDADEHVLDDEPRRRPRKR